MGSAPAPLFSIDRACDVRRVPPVRQRAQLLEERPADAADVVVRVDVEALEERLVEQSSPLVGASAVQIGRALEQIKRRFDNLGACGELLLDGRQFAADALLLARDLVESLPDLRGRGLAIGREVEQSIFLPIEPSQLLPEVIAGPPDSALTVGECFPDGGTHRGQYGGRDAEHLVLVHNRLLHQIGGQVRQVTLDASRGVVEVAGSDGVGVHVGGATV